MVKASSRKRKAPQSPAHYRSPPRLLELGLITIVCLLLLASMGILLLVSAGTVRPHDMAIVSGFASVFILLNMVLTLRGWQEDQVLLPIVALLSGIGLVMARRLGPDVLLRYGGIYGDIALRQTVWLFSGMLVLVAIIFLPWRMRWLKHYRYTWLLSGLLLLGITAFYGAERRGARLWLDFGVLQFQPVEILKILLVIYVATYLDDHRHLIGKHYYLWGLRLPPIPYLIPLLLMWSLTIGLIIIQKDLGAALLFFTIFLAMLYLLTERASYAIAGLIAFVLGAAALYPIFSHVQLRVDDWYDPWYDPLGSGYQMIQSLYAQASGGYTGTGPGLGDPTMIPESHTDFVFVAISEEWGLLVALVLLCCYALFLVRGYQIALRARDGFQQLLAAGLTTAIVVQALIITAGTTNLIPLTGITLPFVSYGGSSILVNFAMVGILLRISSTPKNPRLL
jgi:cell division protein FtsW (lipid II flippase)